MSTQHGFFFTWSAIQEETVSFSTLRLAKYSFSFVASTSEDAGFTAPFSGLLGSVKVGCFAAKLILKAFDEGVGRAPKPENPANTFFFA